MGSLEQAVVNPQQRFKDRIDVRSVAASLSLTEVDHGKFLAVTSASSTAITLTLPSAETATGALIKGMVVSAAGTGNLVLTCSTLGQIVATRVTIDSNGTPTLAGTVTTVEGAAVTILKVAAGTYFELFSTGLKWCIVVQGKFSSA